MAKVTEKFIKLGMSEDLHARLFKRAAEMTLATGERWDVSKLLRHLAERGLDADHTPE